MICRSAFLVWILPVLLVTGCSRFPSRNAIIHEVPPLDWSVNGQRIRDLGCGGKIQDSCPELAALGCDEIAGPGFHLGGLQPPYAVAECIQNGTHSPNMDYFRQPQGLDTRFRSYVVFQDGKYRLLIRKSEFKEIFAPVESDEEALSYAMAMTSLEARFDLDPNTDFHDQVEVIEETHAEETPDGYLVYLFDQSHAMGCDVHPFYAVTVLVTRQGEVHEVNRQEIYRAYSCFDFGALTLEDN